MNEEARHVVVKYRPTWWNS